MKLPIVIRAAAQAEWDEAIDWYESKSLDLSLDFEAKIQDALDRIAANPKRYAIVERDVREADVVRFSYAIYYRIKSDHIAVISIFHTSRDPAIWHSRV